MLPAILVNDKIVTGLHHGDAYQKLTNAEKNDNLLSGFADDHKFITDDQIIYLKEIILVRHAESNTQVVNGKITPNGYHQAKQTAKFIKTLNLVDFNFFSSPYTRCLQTTNIISEECKTCYKIDDQLGKQRHDEDCENFEKRVTEVADHLPKKSIIITHTDFIKSLLHITKLDDIDLIPNCSITYIFYNRLIWKAKKVLT